MLYFSEKELGEVPREVHKIKRTVWKGIRALIKARVDDGSFGASFPENCPEGVITVGTNPPGFRDAMRAHVYGLSAWPWAETAKMPSTPAFLNLIEFCWIHIATPKSQQYHSSYHHNHLLQFDQEAGREDFRDGIEDILRLNGLAYQLTADGHIERLVYPVLREALADTDLDTLDPDLDELLDKSRRKFRDPDESIRREALEHLWDAWEKLRSLDGVGSVGERADKLLRKVAGPDSLSFKKVLDKEALYIYDLGNELAIRHRNFKQERIARIEHVDYLFHRMFSLIQLILRTR